MREKVLMHDIKKKSFDQERYYPLRKPPTPTPTLFATHSLSASEVLTKRNDYRRWLPPLKAGVQTAQFGILYYGRIFHAKHVASQNLYWKRGKKRWFVMTFLQENIQKLLRYQIDLMSFDLLKACECNMIKLFFKERKK